MNYKKYLRKILKCEVQSYLTFLILQGALFVKDLVKTIEQVFII